MIELIDLLNTDTSCRQYAGYLDLIVDSGVSLAIIAANNQQLLCQKTQFAPGEYNEWMHKELRAKLRPHTGALPIDFDDGEIPLRKTAVPGIEEDFETILNPGEPGVRLFLAALRGDLNALQAVVAVSLPPVLKRYGGVSAQAALLSNDEIQLTGNIGQMLDVLDGHFEVADLKKAMPWAVCELSARQMRKALAASEGAAAVVPKRRATERV